MAKAGLEGAVESRNVLSERAIFREYMAYVKGDLPDELGTRGNRIMDQADTISKNLGYSSIKEWLASFREDEVTLSPAEKIEQIKKDYYKVNHLGKSARETEQALSIIKEHGEMYNLKKSESLFFMSYEKKRKIISQMKQYCRTALYLEGQPTVQVK